MDNNFIIDSSKVIDEMKPYEFRFQKSKESKYYILPLTKYNEQYFLAKQIYLEDYFNHIRIHYYIINKLYEVIGRFDAGLDLSSGGGLTYHIIDKFQNRGIGQVVLNFVIDDIFNSYNIDNIKILPINDRSKTLALKSGFSKIGKRVYKLDLLTYQDLKSNSENIKK